MKIINAVEMIAKIEIWKNEHYLGEEYDK